MFGVDVVDLSLQFEDLLGLDGDVRGLTLKRRTTSPISIVPNVTRQRHLTLAPPEG